ncbi:MAG: pentapeptide repeat-containing protein, partial [Acaryochloridaceae cyanobacterium SU_2_1]|nr:pentapeptide repeat-containing protein [Acaryochloridaceae cyanobacterium SU_2_1]
MNVLILLLEIHRYAQLVDALKAQIYFYPCGQPDTEGHDPGRLLRIMRYSDCWQLGTFNQRLGKFLRSANLRSADLSSVDLSGADLSGADLSRANLS